MTDLLQNDDTPITEEGGSSTNSKARASGLVEGLVNISQNQPDERQQTEAQKKTAEKENVMASNVTSRQLLPEKFTISKVARSYNR